MTSTLNALLHDGAPPRPGLPAAGVGDSRCALLPDALRWAWGG